MSKHEDILIINYDFPPNSGIGGRRWAKFAKQLAAEGFNVHVIKSDPVDGFDTSTWTSDISSEKIKVHSLPRKYPGLFSHPKPDPYSRVMYRFHKWNISRKESGTIYDISIGWRENLQSKAKELIAKHNIRMVCATGAPWKMLFDVVQLKEELPNIKVLVDYRDPWLNARNYGMPGLNESRRKEEERKQTYIVKNADVVITPYEYLTAELKEWNVRHGGSSTVFETITHCYDPADIKTDGIKRSGKIKLVYGGDLYEGMETELEVLKNSILVLKEQNPELYDQLEIRIFTNKHQVKIFDDLPVIKIHPGIGSKIFDEISSSDGVLIMLPENKKNDRTTKFFESLPYRKPFVVISEPGEVSDFVLKHQLGYVLQKTGNGLATIVNDLKLGAPVFNHSFDHSQFNLQQITSQLVKLFH